MNMINYFEIVTLLVDLLNEKNTCECEKDVDPDAEEFTPCVYCLAKILMDDDEEEDEDFFDE